VTARLGWVVTLVLVYTSWLFTGWIPGDRAVVADLLFLPITATAAWAAWTASSSDRLAWRLISLGLGGQLLGGVAALCYEGILDQSPYPSLADPLYLSFYPLVLAGLVALRGTGRRASTSLRLALDLATTALGGAAVVWYLVLGPTTQAGEDPLQMLFSVAYPVGDMILIVGLASVLLRDTTDSTRRALWLLAGGLVLFVAGDVVYAYATLHGTFSGGDALNLTYYVAFALFAVAAWRVRFGSSERDAQPRRHHRRVSWMPYLGVASGFAVLAAADLPTLLPNGILAVTAALLAALVSIRQLLAQRELVTARQELQSAHDDLTRAYAAERSAAAERERMEIELRLAQKLEAVGQLAAGIAHEINTPIQFIGDTGRFLNDAYRDLMPLLETYREIAQLARAGPVPVELIDRADVAAEDADLDYLRERIPGAFARVDDGIGRVATIVNAMRVFAHPSTDQSATDINEAIRTTLIVSANEYKYTADVETNLHARSLVACSSGDIHQVLLNLVVNAAHAIADADSGENTRGLITIATRDAHDAVVVTVADTGCGIDAGIAGRVFDPFFTTKEVGRGTGQGLAITRAIVVDRHGGTLTFDSTPGAGTTFTVNLPRPEPAAL
jgi:signal transduction histidine kinase